MDFCLIPNLNNKGHFQNINVKLTTMKGAGGPFAAPNTARITSCLAKNSPNTLYIDLVITPVEEECNNTSVSCSLFGT